MARRFLTAMWALVGLALLGALSPAGAQSAVRTRPVYLRVLLPQDDAELRIDKQPTQQTGTSRSFVSPPLELGQTFTYTLTATWEPNNYTTITRTRQVVVRAGQEVEADLRKADDRNPDKIVIRYVPTPPEAVEAMCKLAGVTKEDVVYDLGCGDGRLVITAVQQFGAKRGIGVDLDPERIQESKENARAAGVADKIEFRQGDVLNIKDLAEASVVLLYMGEDVNLRLRPILQKTLKPGARIVSHQFSMGDWKPSQSLTVSTDEGECELFLWKFGANGGAKKDPR
ncbi:MAG: TIGR03000 domain-containing protein [Gemmataceae bacterium]|nr:TIGR03000 domain-containing protein [Gemmataceae bacterium]